MESGAERDLIRSSEDRGADRGAVCASAGMVSGETLAHHAVDVLSQDFFWGLCRM